MSWRLVEGDNVLDELADPEVNIRPGPAETVPTGSREEPEKDRPGMRDPGHVEFTTTAKLDPPGEYRLIHHDDGRELNLEIDAGARLDKGEILARVLPRVLDPEDDRELPPRTSQE